MKWKHLRLVQCSHLRKASAEGYSGRQSEGKTNSKYPQEDVFGSPKIQFSRELQDLDS